MEGAGSQLPPGQLLPENHGSGHMTPPSPRVTFCFLIFDYFEFVCHDDDNVNVVDGRQWANLSGIDIHIILQMSFLSMYNPESLIHANAYISSSSFYLFPSYFDGGPRSWGRCLKNEAYIAERRQNRQRDSQSFGVTKIQRF